MITIKKVFTGDDKEKQVEKYFERYHPFGYGTKIVSKTDNEIIVVRDSTCD